MFCVGKKAQICEPPILDAYVYSQSRIAVDQLHGTPWNLEDLYANKANTVEPALQVSTSLHLAGHRHHRSDLIEHSYNPASLSSDAAYSTKLLVCLCSIFSGRFL